MASQGGNNGNFDFNAGAGIDFTGFGMQPAAYGHLKGTGEGSTSPAFFFGDEGIDTTGNSFEHSFDSMFGPVGDMNSTSFGIEPLGLDNTTGSASWFPTTPAQSFDPLYAPQFNPMSKRPLQLEVQDFPQAKRHEAFSPFSTSASITGSSNWGLDTQPTPANSDHVGLSDEAADVCATWFSKYNVLPSDRHIDSLSQLTGESATAIRQWFGQALKQGMTGQDSAYKSQTGFTQDPLFNQIPHTTAGIAPQLAISDISCNHDTAHVPATTLSQSPLRGGKKGCNPINNPELLKRDPNKIYQCTRKCGKRYGRKCDWKRNEEEGYPSKSWLCSLCVSEGVDRVKPCFRKYHFSQHFRNIHPGLNSADYEESSIVHSDTSLPRTAQRCGFCTHRFVSRQDRIDHIAEHFKNGKCMLDWKDDDDYNDSDDMNDDDDNDDRPDSGGGFGNGKPYFPPQNDPRGSGTGPKSNGSDGSSGSQPPQGGFYQFQVSQFADNDNRGASPGTDQHIQPTVKSDAATCSKSAQDRLGDTTTTESRGTYDNKCAVHGRHEKTTADDSQTLAGDVVSLLESDVVRLQTIPQRVPRSDGDPAPDCQTAVTPGLNGTGPLTREAETILGSLKLLGTGGFSTVDEVVHRETSLHFARKTLKNRERSALEELKNEVDVLKKLRHPHIIRFVDSVHKGDRMSILLSPVAETTLAAWLDTNALNRPAGLAQTIVGMLGCLASSIRYLHQQRPVVKHMDIKPQNILVKLGSESPHVILSDFGVSSIGEVTVCSKTMPLTRQYCAPEVSEGTSRELASDVWSLGCVYLEMLAVAFKEDNPSWQNFRQQFGGRKGKYYWQDVSALQGLLTQSLGQATTQTEANAARTVKEMLSPDPAERPTAPKLTMVFTPAPCCLSWPNEQVAYPGPLEELQTVKTLFQEHGADGCCHLHVVNAQVKQQAESIAHAKRWLEECSRDHEACRHSQPDLAPKTLPTRLVDILPKGKEGVSVRIVNSADLNDRPSPDYATVSYLWTEQELTLSTHRLREMQTDLPRDTLPKAINEAIAKAQDIGFRYIWVDSLCVLQDSKEDKERECRATADVYRNASLTIVLDQLKSKTHPTGLKKANDSGNNLPSQGTTAKKGEEQLVLSAASLPVITFLTPGFAWDTRAWSLQERLLSRRFLHLGEEQMYWECNTLKASETFPRGLESFRNALPSLLWEKVHTKSSYARAETQTRPYDHKHPTFDVGSSGIADVHGHAATCALHRADAPCACRSKGYGKPSTPHAHGMEVSPHLERDCQYIRKEEDAVGDSMEAAHMQLRRTSSTLPDPIGLDHDRKLARVAKGLDSLGVKLEDMDVSMS